MSAAKRRNMLYGFAAVVVALLAVIVYVSPRFRTEEASGAIGAVQKHRAPQIQKADVILGDETAKKEQKLLYADFLADAAALQNVSADVALAVRSNEAKSQLEAIDRGIGTRVAEVQARYDANMREQMAALASIAKESQNDRANAILSRISADVQHKSQLSAREMSELNVRLAEAVQAVESRDAQALESRDAQALEARKHALQSRNDQAVESRNDLQSLEAAATQLAGMKAQLKTAENLDGVRISLAAVEQQLGSRADIINMNNRAEIIDMNSRASIQAREQYLASMAREAESLQNAGKALSALMSEELNAASRIQLSSADRAASDLAHAAEQLESEALQGMKAHLQSEANEVAALGRVSESLESVRQIAESRTNFEARSLKAFADQVALMQRTLQSRMVSVKARASVDMRGQLDALNSRLQSRQILSARLAESLGNEAALAARIENRDALSGLANHLVMLNHSAEDRALASALPDAQAFAAEARTLLTRTEELQGARQRQ